MSSPSDADKTADQPAGRTAKVTRRTLLGASLGFAALQTADAQTLPSQTMSPQTTNPASDEPGLLAKSRLKPEVVALMTGATRFWAMHAREEAGDPKTGSGRSTSYYVSSPLFSVAPMAKPTPQERPMAHRLAALLLTDELWTEKWWWQPDFTPDFAFCFADTFPGIIVLVCPRAHEIRLQWTYEPHPGWASVARSNSLLFDPVGEEMTAFIKDAFPGDPAAQALTFSPKPAKPLPIPSRPPQVPPALWAKITALRPGMTRADLLAVFEEEGGLSNRMGQTYIIQKFQNNAKGGQFLKINAEFAPADFPLFWRNGKGFLQNPEDVPKAARGRGLPTDIITSLSPVYWGYMTLD